MNVEDPRPIYYWGVFCTKCHNPQIVKSWVKQTICKRCGLHFCVLPKSKFSRVAMRFHTLAEAVGWRTMILENYKDEITINNVILKFQSESGKAKTDFPVTEEKEEVEA